MRLELASRYLMEGRDAEAAPVVNEMVDMLEAELAAGVRHPKTLYYLALAYLWQGHHDEAFEMLSMAVDYGFDQMGWKPPESVETDEYDPFRHDWQALEDHRYQEQLHRQEASVERKAANIRALLDSYDIDQLLAPVIEVHAASYHTVQSEP